MSNKSYLFSICVAIFMLKVDDILSEFREILPKIFFLMENLRCAEMFVKFRRESSKNRIRKEKKIEKNYFYIRVSSKKVDT